MTVNARSMQYNIMGAYNQMTTTNLNQILATKQRVLFNKTQFSKKDVAVAESYVRELPKTFQIVNGMLTNPNVQPKDLLAYISSLLKKEKKKALVSPKGRLDRQVRLNCYQQMYCFLVLASFKYYIMVMADKLGPAYKPMMDVVYKELALTNDFSTLIRYIKEHSKERPHVKDNLDFFRKKVVYEMHLEMEMWKDI